MKTLSAVIFLALLLSLACCKKTDPSFSGAKVLKYTHLVGGLVDYYAYDGNQNVTVITHSSGDKTLFTYTTDTVFKEYIIGGTVVASATTYLLHGQKYADTSIGLYQSQHNSSWYTYNSDGQLTQQKDYTSGALTTITDVGITDKNVTSITITNVAANTHTYSYFEHNTVASTIGNQNFGQGFLGVGTLYLPTRQVTLNDNGDTAAIVTYNYHYDANSNVDTMSTHDRYGHLIDSLAYGY